MFEMIYKQKLGGNRVEETRLFVKGDGWTGKEAIEEVIALQNHKERPVEREISRKNRSLLFDGRRQDRCEVVD